MLTSRRSRTLAWLGTIPHWFYFAALRANQPLWYQIVVWTSGLGVVLALLGLILGVTQYRWSRPRAATGIPYSGWMRWHYITGVIFGVFTLTWVFSGMLSMEPYGWATQPGLQIPRDAFTGGTVDLSRFAAMDPVEMGSGDGRPRRHQRGRVPPHSRRTATTASEPRARWPSRGGVSDCISPTTFPAACRATGFSSTPRRLRSATSHSAPTPFSRG